MRDESPVPRNSRELAVRNQFFTPRYVVQYLVDNTLGRLWLEMQGGQTRLTELCEYLVLTAEEKIEERPRKDPRDLRILDPASGSGHFLLYSFDLMLAIYDEAWSAERIGPPSDATGNSLRADYPVLADLRRAAPRLIVEHNLHGVDIDPRCAQIAALALWLRAQRAWNKLAISPSNRPRIHRTHIVVAEPMPGDAALVEEFAARLEPALLRDLFKKMVGESLLAGELGTLLRVEDGISAELRRAREHFVKKRQTTGYLPGMEPVEKQSVLDLSGIDDDRFFHDAEIRIIEALRVFADTATGSASVRRRLFAGDATQGVALIDLLRKKFDILLMNPPFGEATQSAAKYIDMYYNETRLDLFAAFTARLLTLASPRGLIGAITPRDGFFKKTLGGWRELVLQHHMTVVADLGIGVLDAVTVRVAAYVIENRLTDAPTRFIDLVDIPDREERLRNEVREPQRIHDVLLRSFRQLPLARFLYWLPSRLWEIFKDAKPLENVACTPRYGLTTLDDGRFCRLSYEVDPATVGPSHSWVFMSKGGDDFPYGGLSSCLVKWQNDATEMAEVNRQSNGQVAQTRRASKYYFIPAVTFSNRSVQFSVRWHPSNFVFSVRGPAIIPLAASQAYLLGFFNSRLIRSLIEMQTASKTYTSGVLKELRCAEPDDKYRLAVERAAEEAFRQVRRRLSTVETDPFFGGIFDAFDPEASKGVHAYVLWRKAFVHELNEEVVGLQSEIDATVAGIYGVSIEDIMRCERSEESEEPELGFPPKFVFSTSDGDALISYLFGRAIGRWGAPAMEGEPKLTDAAPSVAPAALPTSAAVPVVVEDEGHPKDIVSAIDRELENVFTDPSATSLAELEKMVGASLRDWIRQSFFSKHLVAYASFGRQAPVYLQIGTATGSYSIWLYLHALTHDTLYNVQNDFLVPKLDHEERKLAEMRTLLGPSPITARRKELTAQESLVGELRSFLDEVKRVAPLWSPSLDDGVCIGFAPFWRLFSHHKTWQKKLKATWDELAGGEYDWAHIAMYLWPERVVRKCAADRSLAVAHGLEDVFWAEVQDGKWKPRQIPTRAVDELVRERASIAVKSALKSLLDTPDGSANGVRGSKRRAVNASTNIGAR